MQVVGSNSPIPCFKIEWMKTQPSVEEPDTPNPLVAVGTYSPSTIEYLLETTFSVKGG